MLHPSYMELMDKINNGVEDDQPLVQSRYAIVLAAAKRARQITEIEERTGIGDPKNKPLSQAVKELYNGSTRILTEAEIAEEEEKLQALIEATKELRDAENEVSLMEELELSEDFSEEAAEGEEAEEATEETAEEVDENESESEQE